MPYSAGNQGVNISSGIGAGEAQVFTPFVQAPAYTAKDYIDLYDKKKKEDEAKAAAIAKAQQEAGKAKADAYEKTSKALLLLKDKPLLPGYTKWAEKESKKIYEEDFFKIYSDPFLDDNEKQIKLNQRITEFSQKLGAYAAATSDFKKINEDVNKSAKDGGKTINYNETFGTETPDDVEDFHKRVTDHNVKVKTFPTETITEAALDKNYYQTETTTTSEQIRDSKGKETGDKKVSTISLPKKELVDAYTENAINNIDFQLGKDNNVEFVPKAGKAQAYDVWQAVKIENPDLYNGLLTKDENGTITGFNNDNVKKFQDLVRAKIPEYFKGYTVKTEVFEKKLQSVVNVKGGDIKTTINMPNATNQEETLALEFSKANGMTAKGAIRDIYNAPLSQTSRFVLTGSQATPISLSGLNTMSGEKLNTANINGHTFTGTNFTVGFLDNNSKGWANGMHTTAETDSYMKVIIDKYKIKSKDELYNLLTNNKEVSRKLIHLTGNLTWEEGGDKTKKTVEVAIPLVNAISNMTPTTKAKTATKTTSAQENKYTNKEYLGIVNAAANTLWNSYEANAVNAPTPPPTPAPPPSPDVYNNKLVKKKNNN